MAFESSRPVTPWPIERGRHPTGTKEGCGVRRTKCSAEDKKCREAQEECERVEVAKECFQKPAEFRDMVLESVRVKPSEDFDGGSVFYMWMNKTCPVGCEFCFFKSPAKDEEGARTEVTDEGIEKLVQFTQDGRMDKFVVSGGGEPMKSKKKLFELARRVKVKTFVVVTSGYWAKGKESTDRTLTGFYQSSKENPNNPNTVLRLSFDQEHHRRLCGSKPFEYMENIVDWLSANALNDKKFRLLIHTMEGDDTVDKLLERLPVASREETGDRFNRKTNVRLENGLEFCVEYSPIFESDAHVDLSDEEKVARNTRTFNNFITHRKAGRMAVKPQNEGSSGVDFLLLYDGSVEVWGATAPDTETSIYEDDYKDTMRKNLADVLTLGTLEKPTFHIQELVAEVSPISVKRAVAMGLRDFYMRSMFEEDTVRLYVSVRLMQEYVKEGRISPEEMAAWPAQLRAMVALDKDKLASICRESPYNIVSQYLNDPEVSLEKLQALYRLVKLGHYNVTPEQMVKMVTESQIDQTLKEEFVQEVAKSAA